MFVSISTYKLHASEIGVCMYLCNSLLTNLVLLSISSMTMTRRNRTNSRNVGGRSVGLVRGWFSSKSEGVANTSTTPLLILMSMFALILMSTKLNLILHQHQAALSIIKSGELFHQQQQFSSASSLIHCYCQGQG